METTVNNKSYMAFTSLEQSQKLAEILPLESADMSYRPYREESGIPDYQVTLCPHVFASWIGIPCWSLAALLGAIAVYGIIDILFLQSTFDNRGNHLTNVWCLTFEDLGTITHDTYADNLIDACYEMILKLNKLKLL